MNLRLGAPAAAGLLCLLTACRADVRAAAHYDLDGRSVVYGSRNGQAGFLVFTDLTGSTTDARARDAAVAGAVQGADGRRLEWAVVDGSFTLNGRRFALSDGIVFLAAPGADSTPVMQLPLSADDVRHRTDDMMAEIRRVAERDAIRQFLGGGPAS